MDSFYFVPLCVCVYARAFVYVYECLYESDLFKCKQVIMYIYVYFSILRHQIACNFDFGWISSRVSMYCMHVC